MHWITNYEAIIGHSRSHLNGIMKEDGRVQCAEKWMSVTMVG